MNQNVPTKFKQLFKLMPPIDIFYKFLDLNFEYENNMYKVNGMFFNKCIYKNTLNDFCEKISPFYHKSKQKFSNINNDYTKFSTMIRHLSKLYEFEYKKNIKYDNSSYNIEYNIIIPRLSSVINV
uniref:Uncharacterized protein n=1 Tax=viral metagenome TaxID=1070528 RepID=A0A6C0HQ41_9ZZZZ